MNNKIPFFKNTLKGFNSKKHIIKIGEGSDYQNSIDFCHSWMSQLVGHNRILFTKSCTQSLEMALMLLDFPAGSEVVIPSYGFVALANAVSLNSLKCVFIDCEKETFNIDPQALEAAISPKTKAVISINYGGVSCNYDAIKQICNVNKLILIEDNAHGLLSTYKDSLLGSIGDLATVSFDSLKNISSYEGGVLIVNNEALWNRAVQCFEFGTNRHEFMAGQIPYYEWVSNGTNGPLAKILFPLLEFQFKQAENIISNYKNSWEYYQMGLEKLRESGRLSTIHTLQRGKHNGYMFWIKLNSTGERAALKQHLKNHGIESAQHYSALHLSKYGKLVGEFRGNDENTRNAVECMLRLPLYYGLKGVDSIIDNILNFYD